MPPTDRRAPAGGQSGRGRRHRIARRIGLALCASFFWMIVGLGGIPAHAATRHLTADHGHPTNTSSVVTTTHATDVVHGHKEGPFAVAISVIGVIVVVVLIVTLGSISVRRRTRDGPPGGRREPPDRRRGLFG